MEILPRSMNAKIVLPAEDSSVKSPPPWLEPVRIPHRGRTAWAPAWFYSALALLGATYTAADRTEQAFGPVLGGSDVDPYAKLGATRLFLIIRAGDGFSLSFAPNATSDAPLTGGTTYPRTDAGITAMFTALAATPAFAAAKYAWVAGGGAFFAEVASIRAASVHGGYDPATGLRSLVLGSAVAQAVPLETFLVSRNIQVYDPNPQIVPLYTSVVYDITEHKTVGDTTFTLPAVYTRDQVSAGTYYVNRMAGPVVPNPGGPGSSANDPQAAVSALTFTGASPLDAFSQQTIAGFYKADGWTNTLGTPIWDYGAANVQFTGTAAEVAAPVTVFDPTESTLNGGSLPAVLTALRRADHLYSADEVAAILTDARAARSSDAVLALAVTTAALGFDLSSSPTSAIVDQLSVPVTVDVTITSPTWTTRLKQPEPAPEVASPPALDVPGKVVHDVPVNVVREVLPNFVHEVPIGIVANAPAAAPPAPVSLQLGLEAFVPREALAGTGISSLETGTAFPGQELGAWSAFSASAVGTVVNLNAMEGGDATPAPYDLDLSTLGLSLTAGATYVASMQGRAVTIRGADGATLSATLEIAPPDQAHEFVGAFIASASSAITLYPKVPITLPAPAAGTFGVQQGVAYALLLTYDPKQSKCDLVGPSGATVTIDAPGAEPSDGSSPATGALFFGSFTGGASEMTVWSVPVFLAVTPSELTTAGASSQSSGDIDVKAIVGGLPSYRLKITDSSLFIFSNIDVDSRSAGDTSSSEVFVAGAAVNSAPDDTTAAAFAPCSLTLGLVRPVQMGAGERYVFIPEADSIVIGGVPYLASVIELDELTTDPGALPYPPAVWPRARYWQFANRHDPYLDVRYEGETQDDRIAHAEEDIARIGLSLSAAQEPIHMYLDTNRRRMTVWPIYAFPFSQATQVVDHGLLTSLTQSVLQILAESTNPAPPPGTPEGMIVGQEQIDLPAELLQDNPYFDSTTGAGDGSVSDGLTAAGVSSSVPTVLGLPVTNLNPSRVTAPSASSFDAQQAMKAHSLQQAAAATSSAKNFMAMLPVLQTKGVQATAAVSAASTRGKRTIYGFSVFDRSSGEAYLVEVVMTDLAVPDRLPDPTKNATYDPFYVRVVFLSTMTCYSMSIIVPTVAYDQFGYFAREQTEYGNVLSKTNELNIGYAYGLYDAANNFDTLRFTPYSETANTGGNSGALTNPDDASQPVVFTNLPYSTDQTAIFSPASLFSDFHLALGLEAERAAIAIAGNGPVAVRALGLGSVIFRQPKAPPPYFLCRRKNWSADCHLMQATVPLGTSVFLAFGAGDIVPLRLDKPVVVDKRLPAHMNQLSYARTDRAYDAVRTVSVGNAPYIVAVTTQAGVARYSSFSLNPNAGPAVTQVAASQPMTFPTECFVVGQASTTLTSVDQINQRLGGTNYTTTGDFFGLDSSDNVTDQFAVVEFNNLVYLVRAVNNADALGAIGGGGVTSGLLIDTFVPTSTGSLALAQSARYKRSKMAFFGASYTPTTMADSLDNLDFTSITGETFYAPTVFVPIPEMDASAGIVADISSFAGEQFWTFLYSEIVAEPGDTVNGVTYPNGFNLDVESKPVLTVQKLQFVYDPIAVLFTPNDLTHKYPLNAKQAVLALTNGQVREGIAWRSVAVQPDREAPHNVRAQQLIPNGPDFDAANIIYWSHNRPVSTPTVAGYLGMSVHRIKSLSAAVYNIEESAFSTDQTATGFISAVSSNSNMILGVLFDYDNNDQGMLNVYDPDLTNKGLVFVNGYLGASGYAFSSPDHMDVNDVLPSQLPLLEQIAVTMGLGWDVAFYDVDVSLPREFWSFSYDTLTALGLPNFIANAPAASADPAYLNRTRSLLLNLQNPVRPKQLGMMDTYSSIVSANLTLENGVTGSLFLSKKADRNVASIGSNPTGGTTYPLYGLPTKYDFFLFSRDHYDTLDGVQFELIDHGYAMVLVDDGSGTGTKVAKYYVDSDGNYYELYSYVLFSPVTGAMETQTFPLKVTLGSPANPNTTPATPETPNNVNPMDLVAQINTLSNLVYAAFGPTAPGQSPAFLPIQATGTGEVQAGTIADAPGFNGYALNVVGANRQPVQITQVYSGGTTYAIAGTSTTVPINPARQKPIPFYGSISHGLDKQVSYPALYSADLSSHIPRPTSPQTVTSGLFGGNGLGALIGTPLSFAFQGSGAIPPQVAGNPAPGTTMKADDGIFYTVNVLTNSTMDSTGKPGAFGGGQYFVDTTDPDNPIYGVVSLPKFTFGSNTYSVILSTTLPDGVTSRYSLVVGGRSFLFGPDNAHVTVDGTEFTFNPIAGGTYTVTRSAVDAPEGAEAPSPIALTPFSVVAGGGIATIDVFNNPGGLTDMVLGVTGRLYTYDPVGGTVTVSEGGTETNCPIETGLAFGSTSNYGYVLGVVEGQYTVNGETGYLYRASTSGAPASYPLMTAPQMFTLGGDYYTFDLTANGAYQSVTGAGQVVLVNQYQFSLNGQIYIIDTNVTPNTVIGNGVTYQMTDSNTQFVIDGVPYTLALKQNSLLGATISGQFDITQGNVIVIENYVYQLDTLNGQIVGNGSVYPLTTSGVTYSITTQDRSFTVTTESNATTVTIGNIDYLINGTTVVGDGVTYPILVFRSFTDGTATFDIGLDGTVTTPTTFPLSGTVPFTGSTFTDGATYTVNKPAAFDGTTYYLMTGSPPAFTTPAHTYTVRTDGVAIATGPARTYLGATGPLSPNSFTFGSETISFGRPADLAAFDGTHYFAIASNQFTDTDSGLTFTLSGNTAVNEGNSYEIFSNLGATPYFEVPGGSTYEINLPVADTGSATGDEFNVFPMNGGAFTMPVKYTLSVAGTDVSVEAVTFTGGPTVVPTLTAAAGVLTGGYFTDPVTGITYTVVVDGALITVLDSTNTVYPYPAPGMTDAFVASVVVSTGVTIAVDDEAPPAIYPVVNNQFSVGTTTYTVQVPVAYENAAGPYWPVVNGRFIVPQAAPLSPVTYTISGSSVTKGYVVSADDQFSVDGKVVYTINAVNVVKTDNQATLSGGGATETLDAGPLTYTLDAPDSRATIEIPGLTYDSAHSTLAVDYVGTKVTFTINGNTVTDNRKPVNVFTATTSGSTLSFTDTVNNVSFSFDPSGDNPVTAGFVYENAFFIDALAGVTYYIDDATKVVNAISYLPETTAYGFTAANGITYLIDYHDVTVVFPVVSGSHVDVGVATVGDNEFDMHVDDVSPLGGGTPIPTNPNSFEINGNLYSIIGTPVGTDYSACSVVGIGVPPVTFNSPNTFVLTDPSINYTLHLDVDDLPSAVTASFPVKPSRAIISVADDVYIISYATTTTGSLLGQGLSSIPIAMSSFTLTNRFDQTKASFTFADLDIYDASAVVGRFTVYAAPTFTLGATTYTLDTVNRVVRDSSKRPYPLIPNPQMFSITGANYVIDTNRVPHAIVGNDTVSALSTDVTIENGEEVPNSTFTLGGQIYRYVEDALGNLLAVTGTRLYPIAAPAMTFKLDSSLVFTLSTTPPTAGNYVGTDVPIGTVTSGTLVLNVYGGRPESGNMPFFVYKNALYTLLQSGGSYLAVQKTYTVYVSTPVAGQQQFAVFDLNGTTYLVTDGTTTGSASPSGINPGTLWAQTSVTNVETQFGLVSGFGPIPTTVTEAEVSPTEILFQFQVTVPTGIGATTATTLYDIVYTAGSNANVVQVDVPLALPTFTQTSLFTFVKAYPLALETGGYNAFTTFVDETSLPAESFAAAFRTPVVSTDAKVDSLMTEHGDFSLEFWHSIPSTTPAAYHPFSYSASTPAMPVYYVDVDFEDSSRIYVEINNSVLTTSVTPPVFSSKWQHFALSYTQPYVMLCQGDGFEVKSGSNYNVSRDFSVAFTFSAADVDTPQGIVYKGAASDISNPAFVASYRVTVEGSTIALSVTDATGVTRKVTGPPNALQSGNFYEVVIVKRTTSPLGRSDQADPYAPPFDPSDLGAAMSGGASANVNPPLNAGSGSITVSGFHPATQTPTTDLINALAATPSKSFEVDINIRPVFDDGSFGDWVSNTAMETVSTDPQLQVISTGTAHLLLGCAYDDNGNKMGLGSTASPANLRDVYLFGSAIDNTGIHTNAGPVPISQATAEQLKAASISGYWKAAYDPDGIVDNPINPADVAISMNATTASLAPLAGHELEGAALFINGYPMTLSPVTGGDVPSSITGYSPGSSLLDLNAGVYKLQELSIWRMARQQYQVIDDMFGRLVPSNEPDLVVYLSGSFVVQSVDAPALPLKKYIDQIQVKNQVTPFDIAFSPASLDLSGSPAVGRCGPLITPNLYTPPGDALTVCDAPPALTTYSVTLNSVTGTLAGEINEAYAYIKNGVLMLYTGKKVGDLVLSWVSQEQGEVQVIGYMEGAPPAPMANLTNKPLYAGATSMTLSAVTSLALKYQKQDQDDTNNDLKLTGDLAFAQPAAAAGATATATTSTGTEFNIKVNISPLGAGVHTSGVKVDIGGNAAVNLSWTNSSGTTHTASDKLDESNRYTVKLQGAMTPYTGDLFMASLNTLTTPSTTPGTPASKTAILPDPNVSGFTISNPPGQLPRTAPTEEQFGSRMFQPSPYGQAFVTSQTEDVYQQTLLQSNTVYGFVRIPNAQIPRDLNIVTFRISSSYLRPGILDGFIGYGYKPATLPTGARTFTTSTGEMVPVHDGNFEEGEVGHNASYMRVVEAYSLKRQIDQEAFTALAQYKSAFNADDQPDANETRFVPALDFYNEYVWSARGGNQEVKHTYSTSYEEVLTTGSGFSWSAGGVFDLKLTFAGVRALTLGLGYTHGDKSSTKFTYTATGSSSFDIAASFDGIETDTQMRYASANDAHFVMKNNSMFNRNNESGLNLVIGSDGLVYNIVPSVTSGAGLPLSNDIDTTHQYTQPQPSYTTGNADGLTGTLVPYDRPGKTNIFRTLAFFLQPSDQNADDFWDTVVDPIWLANSPDPDAEALREADRNASVPWRLLYRVTYSERFLPPVSNDAIVVPQITPLMAVPVLDPPADFLFHDVTLGGPVPAKNPANDIEANVVLVAPTAMGASAGTIQSDGPNEGQPLPPNNVIPFDLVKTAASSVSWGDTANNKLLSQLITSALGQSTVPMTQTLLPHSTFVQSVTDPVNGGTLYSTYIDPNGFTVNVPRDSSITVFQDVNGNPISYFDGKTYHSLQADYVASADGTIMYYIQPPSTYDQSTFDLLGDYDLLGRPGDEWRYYLVSGFSVDMTSDPSVADAGPFLSSAEYTGCTIADSQHTSSGQNQVEGYLIVRGVLQWPSLNAKAESFADVSVYKTLSLVDTFPIGDPEVLRAFLLAQYPDAPFTGNTDISTVFARNIVSYFNTTQQALLPQ